MADEGGNQWLMREAIRRCSPAPNQGQSSVIQRHPKVLTGSQSGAIKRHPASSKAAHLLPIDEEEVVLRLHEE